MHFDYIINKGNALVRRCETRDPFLIAGELGIYILNKEFNKLKGMYKVIKRNRFIFINSNMPEELQKIVCAHELGHDQLHRDLAAADTLSEFALYKMDTKPEYEANVFASEILLPTEEILVYINYGYTAQQIAGVMNTDINLISLKVAILIQQGYKLRGLEHKSNFLKY